MYQYFMKVGDLNQSQWCSYCFIRIELTVLLLQMINCKISRFSSESLMC